MEMITNTERQWKCFHSELQSEQAENSRQQLAALVHFNILSWGG